MVRCETDSTVGAFFIMLFAVGHESHDCGLNCHDGDGILPRQAGHPWTGYQDACHGSGTASPVAVTAGQSASGVDGKLAAG